MPKSPRIVNTPSASSPSNSSSPPPLETASPLPLETASPPPLEAVDLKIALRNLTKKYKRLRTLTRKQKIQKAKKTCPNYGSKIRKTRSNIMRTSKNLVRLFKAAGSKFVV